MVSGPQTGAIADPCTRVVTWLARSITFSVPRPLRIQQIGVREPVRVRRERHAEVGPGRQRVDRTGGRVERHQALAAGHARQLRGVRRPLDRPARQVLAPPQRRPARGRVELEGALGDHRHTRAIRRHGGTPAPREHARAAAVVGRDQDPGRAGSRPSPCRRSGPRSGRPRRWRAPAAQMRGLRQRRCERRARRAPLVSRERTPLRAGRRASAR